MKYGHQSGGEFALGHLQCVTDVPPQPKLSENRNREEMADAGNLGFVSQERSHRR